MPTNTPAGQTLWSIFQKIAGYWLPNYGIDRHLTAIFFRIHRPDIINQPAKV
jgi:hypothetical protein